MKFPDEETLKRAGLPPGFGPAHPDWNIPSKQNRYLEIREQWRYNNALEKAEIANAGFRQKKIRAFRNISDSGRFCITTIVSGDYQFYFPLFWYCAKLACPEAQIMVFLRGENRLDAFWNMLLYPLENGYLKNPDGLTTAALRFTYESPWFDLFDDILITDIDILLMQEEPDIVRAHYAAMKRNNLENYDNYGISDINGQPRCPGVHFITRDWWKVTAAARETEEKILLETTDCLTPGYDERMLYRIIKNSNLIEPPAVPNSGNHHGIHLGAVRRNMSEFASGARTLTATKQSFLKTLTEDKLFMMLVKNCGNENPEIKEIFEIVL